MGLGKMYPGVFTFPCGTAMVSSDALFHTGLGESCIPLQGCQCYCVLLYQFCKDIEIYCSVMIFQVDKLYSNM